MTSADLLRAARRRAGLSLRQLAELAGTSHSTLAAYESGAKTPTVSTLDRIVRAAGFALDATLAPRARPASARGRELEAVLELAAAFPARHTPTMAYPVFPRG